MSVRFECPHCGSSIQGSDDIRGIVVQCGLCEKTFRIPDATTRPQIHNPFEAVCPHCKTTYQNGPSVSGKEMGCGKCGNRFCMPAFSEVALEIDRLVCSFDAMSSAADAAYERLAGIGETAVPRLIQGLKGGTGRRFHSARTLGKIGIDSQVNLLQLSEAGRVAALQAVKDALTWERSNGAGPVSHMICDTLERAIANLSS